MSEDKEIKNKARSWGATCTFGDLAMDNKKLQAMYNDCDH